MPAVSEENEREEFRRIEIFGFEVGLGGEHDQKRDGPQEQVEEEAEGV